MLISQNHFRLLIVWLLLHSCGSHSEFTNSQDITRDQLISQISIAEGLVQTKPDSALFMAKTVFHSAEALKYIDLQARAELVQGLILFQLGNFDQAAELLQSSVGKFYTLDMPYYQIEAFIILKRCYLKLSNHVLARNFIEKAERLSQPNTTLWAQVMSEKGHYYEKSGQPDSALYQQTVALLFARKAMDSLLMANVFENIASVYEDIGNFQIAAAYYDSAYFLHARLQLTVQQIEDLNNIADCWYKVGNLDRGLYFARLSYELAKKENISYQIKSAARDISQVWWAMGQPDSAFLYLDISYSLTEKIFSKQVAENISVMQAMSEAKEREFKIKNLEDQQSNSRIILWLSWTAAVVLISIVGYAYIQRNKKIKKEQQLLEVQHRLGKAELATAQLSQEKLELELQKKKLEEARLSLELREHEQKLSNSALQVIQKSELLEGLMNNLKRIQKSSKEEIQKEVKKLIRHVESHYKLENDWKESEEIFQNLQGAFLENVLREYPDLSSSDLKIIAMIRMQMEPHIMASILGISPDSLRISRYRLKKKLQLGKDDSLTSWAFSLS